MKQSVYERKVSLVDGLALQGVSLEEIAYFLNMSNEDMLVLMEYECIDIYHSELTYEDIEFIEEMKRDCIVNLSKEGYSNRELSEMFNMSLEEVAFYNQPFTSIAELEAIMNRIKSQLK